MALWRQDCRSPTFFSDLCRHIGDTQVFDVQLPQVAQLAQLRGQLSEAWVAEMHVVTVSEHMHEHTHTCTLSTHQPLWPAAASRPPPKPHTLGLIFE